MKKRIFTLMTAALLMAGPAFNAAYAGVVTPVAYSSVAGNTKLANGMKFYLKAGWTTPGVAFATVKEVTLSDNKTKVWTIAGETEADIAKAAVFEVADFQKVGQKYTFTLKVDGKPIYLGTGGTVSANVDAKTITSTMIVASDKLAELAKITPVLDGDDVTENELSAYTTSEEYSAEDLNDYNLNGFTFTFEAKEGTELEGNTFANPMYAVNVGSDLYFVDVNGSDAKALKALKEKTSVTLSDLENSKLKVLALNSDSKYGTSGEKKTAYKILTIARYQIFVVFSLCTLFIIPALLVACEVDVHYIHGIFLQQNRSIQVRICTKSCFSDLSFVSFIYCSYIRLRIRSSETDSTDLV